jgi:NAD(P)-dependent dehydrogenase (short-subunit alcohol dehydrogenase family)
MVDMAVEKFGKLDILVSNAAIMDNFAPVADVPDEMWNNILEVNLTVPFKAFRKAIPVIEKNENGGSIIMISSIGGLRSGAAGAAYVTSKHGTLGLMKAVACEYMKKKIRCNAICPGSIGDTDINNSIERLYPEGAHPEGQALAFEMMNLAPVPGKPEDVARVAVFLGSDDSGYVNGATIMVDGGWNAC